MNKLSICQKKRLSKTINFETKKENNRKLSRIKTKNIIYSFITFECFSEKYGLDFFFGSHLILKLKFFFILKWKNIAFIRSKMKIIGFCLKFVLFSLNYSSDDDQKQYKKKTKTKKIDINDNSAFWEIFHSQHTHIFQQMISFINNNNNNKEIRRPKILFLNQKKKQKTNLWLC
mgnify:CR=1 FL=1